MVKEVLIKKLVTALGFTLPVVPIIVFLLGIVMPHENRPFVQNLGGTWNAWFDGTNRQIFLPGLFQNFGISTTNISVGRKVVLNSRLMNEDLFVTLFWTMFQTGIVTFNGELIGEIGDVTTGRKHGNIQGMEGFQVPKRIVRLTNEIRIDLWTVDKQSFGIQDPRFYIGVSRVLKPYYDMNISINDLFQYGVMFFGLMMLFVILIIAFTQRKTKQLVKYLVTGGFIFSASLFNLAYSGFFVSYLVTQIYQMLFLELTIVVVVLFNLEFIQAYFVGQNNLIGTLNRVICAITVFLYLLTARNNDLSILIYSFFSYYTMAIFAYCLFIVIRVLATSRVRYGNVIAFSVFVEIFAGVSDLLSTMAIIPLPQVSSITVSSFGIVGTLVVIADFVGFSERNMTLSTKLQGRNENLKTMIRELRKKKELEYDMSMASRLQAALLPQSFPDNDRVTITGGSIQAKMVGGDYFDVIPIDERRILCAIADVMGKGMSASLVMVKVQTLLRALSGEKMGLFEMAERINDVISGELKGERFVTLSLLMYDIFEQTVEYALFGHEPVMVYRKTGRKIELYKNENMPLGIENRLVSSGSRTIDLKPGDRIILFTDGVIEAQNDMEQFFGMERFSSIVLENSDEKIQSLFSRVIEKISHFRGTTEQSDDITLLALEVK